MLFRSRIETEDCTLAEFHYLIQGAMGWMNSHLHEFEIAGERYAVSPPFEMGPMDFDAMDAQAVRLSQLIAEQKKFRCKYLYDFGDGWEHLIQLEEVHAPIARAHYPRCVDGERACPPEDVGGVWGYREYLEALADPNHERHDELLEWGSPFDPNEFDAAERTQVMHQGLPAWR